MIRNYIKLAFRSIHNRTSYSFINIFGLSVGMVAALIISLYAIDILTYDNNHQKKDRIFMAYKERITPNGAQPTYDTWVPMADRLEQGFPTVEAAAARYVTECRVIQGASFIEEDIIYSEASLFDIFSFDFSARQGNTAFTDRSSIVISQTMKDKYFGSEIALGKQMEIFLTSEDTIMRFVVSAVFNDQPSNSSIAPDLIIQMKSLPVYDRFANNWGSSFLDTWVLLDHPDSRLSVEAGFPALIEQIWDRETQERTVLKLLPLSEYYDTLLGDTRDAWIMLFIAIGILLIASINFMNLATARSTSRSQEVGVRKVLGAVAGQIRVQFIIEAVIYATISIGIGLIVVFFVIPFLNDFFDLNLQFSTLITFEGILCLIGIAIIIGVLSGSYPAFYLSTISIVRAMRKIGLAGGARGFRNGLIVVQFGLAVLLICGSLLIRNQLTYMHSRDMGFSSEQLLHINASADDFADSETGAIRINSFKKNVSNYAFVEELSASRDIPTDWTRSFTFVRPKGWTGDPMRMRFTYVDASFFPTYKIPFIEGRNFLPDQEGHQRMSAVLNRAAFLALNLDTASTPTLAFGSNEVKVVGVVDDFNFESLRNEIAPTIHFHRTADHAVHDYITIRINTPDLRGAIGTLEEEWDKLGAVTPFRYSFADDLVADLYEAENQFLGLVSFFTLISIFIACLGLYGLTVFVIERKRKEISIRKVVGANLRQITTLILRDFTPWVTIALVIGGYFAYLFFRKWILEFHYQAPIDYLIFVAAAVIVFVLVIVTVSFHTIKAGLANPVKYLREE